MTSQTSLNHQARRDFEQGRFTEVIGSLAPLQARTGVQELLLGRAYLRRGEIPAAKVHCSAAVRLLDGAWGPSFYLGCCCARLRDWAEAEGWFSKALSLNAENPDIYLQRGHARLQSDDLDGAASDYETAERIGAGNEVGLGYECLGLLYTLRGAFGHSCRFLSKAVRLNRTGDDVLWQLGWSCFQTERQEECLAHWSEVCVRHPERKDLRSSLLGVRYALAVRKARAESWTEAEDLLNGCLTDEPWSARASALLGRVWTRQAFDILSSGAREDFGRAIRLLERTQAGCPNDSQLAYYGALIAAEGGRPEVALSLLRQHVARGVPRARYLSGMMHHRLQQPVEARKVWQSLAERGAANRWTRAACLSIGASLAVDRQWENAAVHLRRYRVDQQDPLALGLLAACLYHAGLTSDLESLVSNHHEVLYYQSLSLRDSGRTDAAIARLRATVRSNPGFHPPRSALVSLLCGLTQQQVREAKWEESAALLEEILDLLPRGAESLRRDAGAARILGTLAALGGKRDLASQIGRVALEAKPEGRTLHLLFINHYWDAISKGASGNRARAGNAWCQSVIYLVPLLFDEEYWCRWLKDCEKRYNAPLPIKAGADLRRRIEKHFMELLNPTEPEGVLLRVELGGAHALRESGGARSPLEGGSPFACGRTLLTKLGYGASLSAFVRDQRGSGSASVDAYDERAGKLRRYFSCLGEAQALLENERPREALTALEGVACEDCSTSQPAGIVRLCCESCGQWEARNPAYLRLANRAEQLCRDALSLAAESHLALADLCMTSAQIDYPALTGAWRNLTQLSGQPGAEWAGRSMADRLLGRAAALIENGSLDDAVRLLDMAHETFPEPYRGDVGGRLAELLNRRGVEQANRDEADWEGAAVDLRESVELNQHVPVPNSNLVVVLQRWAGELLESDPERAGALLSEARDLLLRALRNFPNDESLRKQTESVGNLLNQVGVVEANRRRFEASLDLLWLAHELIPESSGVGQTVCDVTASYATTALADGREAQAVVWVRRALEQFPESTQVSIALTTLEGRMDNA